MPNVLVQTLNAAVLAFRPFTVVRVVGEAYLVSDQQAASEQQAVGFGFAVVSTQAVAIGITAIPTPFTDGGSELFFMYQAMLSSLGNASSTGVFQEGTRYSFDQRAMRKVNEGQDIVIVLETAGISGGANIMTWARMLIKHN